MMSRSERKALLLGWLTFSIGALVVGLTADAWEPLVGGTIGGCGFAAMWFLLGRLTR